MTVKFVWSRTMPSTMLLRPTPTSKAPIRVARASPRSCGADRSTANAMIAGCTTPNPIPFRTAATNMPEVDVMYASVTIAAAKLAMPGMMTAARPKRSDRRPASGRDTTTTSE